MRRRAHMLSLRLWLVLTVAALVVATILAEIAMGRAMGAWQQNADQARLAAVRHVIGADAAQWRDPAWQHHAASTLEKLGADVDLYTGQPARVVFATPGARRFLDVGASAGASAATGASTATAGTPTFQRLVIADPATAARPLGVTLLWFTGPSPNSPSPWLWPLAAAAAILLILIAAIALLGRAVLRPLAAMNRAVEGIAGGDLDVHLPPSSAREVAEVGAALEGMSAALRTSLARQAALEEERKLFVGAIAHDLRTPLFMLRGYLKGLESGVAATPEKQAHYISACRARADALERLIADLFAYTRLEYLEQQPAHDPLELGALLRQTVEGMQPLADAKDITLLLDATAEPCALLGDGHLLGRAVENLLDNAVRHTPHGGTIRITWDRDDATLRFAVADTGPGLAIHDLPHVFTPLYRGEASRNRQTGGAGLGLAIARRIVQAHGGDLSAANGPTGGALFTGTLPAARQTPAPVDLVAAASS